MERTNIAELLRTLQPKEIQEFELFLDSPYFNRGKNREPLLRLFQILCESNFGEDDTQLSRQAAYERVFPGKEWVERKLEKLLVDLNKLLRSFLITRHYLREENEFQQQLDLSSVFRAKGLDDRYQQLLQKLKNNQEEYPWKNVDFFFRQFQLEYALHEYECIYNRKKGDLNIPQVLHNLDIFYHLNRLQQLNFFLLQQKLTHLDVADNISYALKENPLPERYLLESSSLLITNKIFHLFMTSNPSSADLYDLVELLTEHEKNIEKHELEHYNTYLRNLCTILINAGSKEVTPILHQLQRDNLERGYLYQSDQHNKITPSTCLNLVSVALRVQNYDWVRDFLESHQDRIIGDNDTRDFYRFNRACYLFAIGQYEAALDHIPAASPYLDYHLMARRLEIKIYFETNSDLLSYKVDSFKMYISRASQKFLSQELRRKNADFVNLIVQIMQSTPGDENRAQRLSKRILEKTGVAEQDWLLAKVKELE